MLIFSFQSKNGVASCQAHMRRRARGGSEPVTSNRNGGSPPARGPSGACGKGHRRRFLDAGRGVEELHRDEVASFVVVENDSWLVLLTLRNGSVPENDRQGVRCGVVVDPHVRLQYFSTLLVR